MKIGREIGPAEPPYVIAEISGNHNGSMATALRLIDAAKSAGADAVKLQAYTPDTITIDHDGPGFVLQEGLWKGRKLYDLYREAHTPPEWFGHLFFHAKRIGIPCFSSVFDRESVDLLEAFGCPAYKIASFEITDTPLIMHAASKGKPIIISTGAVQTDEDISLALAAAGAAPVALLHCVSEYPAHHPHFDRMDDLKRWSDFVGFSDHTLGTAAAVASVEHGACIIERHLKLDDKGPDAAFSSDPSEFGKLVGEIRSAWHAQQVKFSLRRSLYVVENIVAGEMITPQNVRSIRPGHGLHPSHAGHVMGKRAAVSIPRGTPLRWEHLHEADQRLATSGGGIGPVEIASGAGRIGQHIAPGNANMGKSRSVH